MVRHIFQASLYLAHHVLRSPETRSRDTIHHRRVWSGLRDLDNVANNIRITGLENGVTAHDPEYASVEDWREVHYVNTDGAFLGCRYAIRAMREAGSGSISNIDADVGAYAG